MQTINLSTLWLACIVGLTTTLFACGDDDAPAPTADADAAVGDGDGDALYPDAGVAFEDVDPTAQASDLSAAEFQAVCQEVDRITGLVGDLAASCQVDAWLQAQDEAMCNELEDLCLEAEVSVGAFELPQACSVAPEGMDDCTLRVEQMIACAEMMGAFWSARTCEEDHLFDEVPTCILDLSDECPSVYLSEDD
ncbi:MAG: hypothetical protein OXU20_20820 [Myxococcales bacterium]|nr:hypothetical protein [Myxococcales bacterium]